MITAVDAMNSSFCVRAARMKRVSEAFWIVSVTRETYLRNSLLLVALSLALVVAVRCPSSGSMFNFSDSSLSGSYEVGFSPIADKC